MDIVVDFDGTCVTHTFPEVGEDIGAQPILKRIVENGHRLVLFTMRSDGQIEQTMPDGYKMYGGDFLTQAVNWFKENDIPLYGIQVNPTQKTWTTSPKAYGQLIIDDAALGCPLKIDSNLSGRPFVDWDAVRVILEEKGII
jgi:hypothetical protein